MHSGGGLGLRRLPCRATVAAVKPATETNVTIRAREQVDFKMNIPSPLLAKEWSAGLQGLLDHGREATLPATGVQMTGSPLLERLFDNATIGSAQITVTGHRKEAVQKLRVTEPAANQTEQLDDIHDGVSMAQASAAR